MGLTQIRPVKIIGPVSTESVLVQSVQSLQPGNAVRLIEYNAYSHSEKQLERLENLTDSLLDGGVRWFHLQGRPNDEALERGAAQFRFPPLTFAGFKTNPGRSHVEAYDRQSSFLLQF